MNSIYNIGYRCGYMWICIRLRSSGCNVTGSQFLLLFFFFINTVFKIYYTRPCIYTVRFVHASPEDSGTILFFYLLFRIFESSKMKNKNSTDRKCYNDNIVLNITDEVCTIPTCCLPVWFCFVRTPQSSYTHQRQPLKGQTTRLIHHGVHNNNYNLKTKQSL